MVSIPATLDFISGIILAQVVAARSLTQCSVLDHGAKADNSTGIGPALTTSLESMRCTTSNHCCYRHRALRAFWRLLASMQGDILPGAELEPTHRRKHLRSVRPKLGLVYAATCGEAVVCYYFNRELVGEITFRTAPAYCWTDLV